MADRETSQRLEVVVKRPLHTISGNAIKLTLVCIFFLLLDASAVSFLSYSSTQSRNLELLLQQRLLVCVIMLVSLFVFGYTVRALLLFFEFNEAELSLVPSETVPGHPFLVNFKLRPKRKLHISEIRIGLIVKERQVLIDHYQTNNESYNDAHKSVVCKPLYETWVTTGHNATLERNTDCIIEQPIILPTDLQDAACEGFNMDWYAILVVVVPFAPDYRAEFPLEVFNAPGEGGNANLMARF